jgi:inhibitor of KinA
MNKFDITFQAFGNKAILIEWPNKIDEEILDDIIGFLQCILSNEKSLLSNYTSGYNSILFQYNSIINTSQKGHYLLSLYNSTERKNKYIPKSWDIPVCYEENFGFDLPSFVNRGLSSQEVVNLHTSKAFRVFMIGFLPGFIYLGGLPPELHMDRKENPRSHIPKGSIAIGGEQTGIYPMDSPGGWHVIGRTPLSLFDISKKKPISISQGDYIRFYAIDKDVFQNLSFQ